MGAPKASRGRGRQRAASASVEAGDKLVNEVLDLLEAASDGYATIHDQKAHAETTTEVDDLPDEASHGDLESDFKHLTDRVKNLENLALAAVVVGLSNALFQLRAWYCEALGSFLVMLLQTAVERPQRLQQPPAGIDPSLAVCRILEGVLLVCTVAHARSSVATVLEGLLQKRRVPSLAMTRLEATLILLLQEAAPEDTSVVPPALPLEIEVGNAELTRRAESLQPKPDMRQSLDDVKAMLQKVIPHVFPGHEPAYFGGAVNGFETSTSDLDCVVILSADFVNNSLETAEESSSPSCGDPTSRGDSGSHSDAANEAGQRHRSDRRKEKTAAAVAARTLEKALAEDEELQDIGLIAKEVIADARVPILKCDTASGIAVDISFNNSLPLHNSKLLRAYAEIDDRVGDLGRLVKHWAKRRGVNVVLEGTLSSYSHVLLTIHYLQHVGLLPNLQSKEALTREECIDVGYQELVAGVHDVWFWTPDKLDRAHPAVVSWADNAPLDATLEGLLCGFFRYYAYEFPFYAEVVSIRLPGRVPKPDYFRTHVATGDPEEPTGAEVDEPIDTDSPEIAEEIANLEDAAAVDAEASAELNGTPDEEEEEEEEAQTASAETACVAADEETSSPSKGRRLSKQEHYAQHQLNGRMTLCIDDPMEHGRTLGTSFQGAERLVYELRRACELLRDGCSKEALDELFRDNPPKSLWKLVEKRSFPSVLDGGKILRRSLVVPNGQGGAVLGVKGSVIQEMRQTKGITNVSLTFDGPGRGNRGLLRVSGEPAAVEACIARAEALLAEAASAEANGGRKGYARGESSKASASKGHSSKGDTKTGKGSANKGEANIDKGYGGKGEVGTSSSIAWRLSQGSSGANGSDSAGHSGNSRSWYGRANNTGNGASVPWNEEQGKSSYYHTWKSSGGHTGSEASWSSDSWNRTSDSWNRTSDSWNRTRSSWSGKKRAAW